MNPATEAAATTERATPKGLEPTADEATTPGPEVSATLPPAFRGNPRHPRRGSKAAVVAESAPNPTNGAPETCESLQLDKE